MQEFLTRAQPSSGSSVSDLADLVIKSGWFASPYFYAGLLLSLVAITIMFFYNRTAAIRRRQEYLELINLQQQQLIDAQIEAQEVERKRIAKDLHDGVGTALTSVKLMISDCIAGAQLQKIEQAQQINEHLSEIITEIKQIIYDLNPPALERYGLKAGVKNLVERANQMNFIKIDYHFYGDRDVTNKVAVAMYRIIQELLNNTIKHAKASHVRLQINQFDQEMNMMYEDDGIGITVGDKQGLGLGSIESRVRSLKGRMRFETNDQGTFYNFDIPLLPHG